MNASPLAGEGGQAPGVGVCWALVLKPDCMQATSYLSPRLTRPIGSQQGWGLQGGRGAIQQTLRSASLGSGLALLPFSLCDFSKSLDLWASPFSAGKWVST